MLTDEMNKQRIFIKLNLLLMSKQNKNESMNGVVEPVSVPWYHVEEGQWFSTLSGSYNLTPCGSSVSDGFTNHSIGGVGWRSYYHRVSEEDTVA